MLVRPSDMGEKSTMQPELILICGDRRTQCGLPEPVCCRFNWSVIESWCTHTPWILNDNASRLCVEWHRYIMAWPLLERPHTHTNDTFCGHSVESNTFIIMSTMSSSIIINNTNYNLTLTQSMCICSALVMVKSMGVVWGLQRVLGLAFYPHYYSLYIIRLYYRVLLNTL